VGGHISLEKCGTSVPISAVTIIFFYPDEAIQAHLAFLARRRSLRPGEEYRVPTDAEWEEFLGHFELRKVATGTCGRAFGTPCVHEHSCFSELDGRLCLAAD
jgi:hypothetical protein